jgi:drug/metabolite transporter (DMT)-like permease
MFHVAMSPGARRLRLSTPVLAVVLCLVWSSAFIFIKLALRDASAMDFSALRVVAATSLLALALWLQDRTALSSSLRSPRVHGTGLVLGAVSVAGFIGLQTAGFEFAGIGFGAVLIYAQPMLVAVLARVLLGERLRPRQLLGLVTGWAGVALAVLGEVSGGDSGEDVWTAAALFLGAAVCFAISTIVVKAISQARQRVPLPPALLLGFGYGSVPLVLLGLGDGEPVTWTWRLVVCVVYTGTVALAGGYLLQFALLERGGAAVVSSYIFAVPVLTAAYGVALFGEALTAGLVLGAAAVAAGILLVTVPGRPRLLEESP